MLLDLQSSQGTWAASVMQVPPHIGAGPASWRSCTCTPTTSLVDGHAHIVSSQQPANTGLGLLDASEHAAGDRPGNCRSAAAPAASADLVVWHAGIEILPAAEPLEAAAALDGGLDDDEGSQRPVCNVTGLAEERRRGLLALHAWLIGRVWGQGVRLQQKWVGNLSRSQAAAEVGL